MKNKKLYISALIFTISAAYQYIFYNYGINMLDEGLLLNGADRMLQGEIPMIDFFGYPPGKYMYIALFFKLFGISINTARIGLLLLTSSTLMLLFLISSYIISLPFSILPSILLLLAPSAIHSRFFAFLITLNLFFIFKYIEKKDRIYLVLSGLVSGLSLYIRLDIGNFSFLTIGILIIIMDIYEKGRNGIIASLSKDLSVLLLTVIFVLSPILIYAVSDPGSFYNKFLFYKMTAKNFNRNIHIIDRPDPFLYFKSDEVGTKTLFEAWIYYFPIMLYAAAILFIIYRYIKSYDRNGNLYLTALTLFGIQTLSYPLFAYPDLWHALNIYSLVFILTAFFINRVSDTIYLHKKWCYTAVSFAVLSFAVITIANYGALFGSMGAMREEDTFIERDRGKLFVTKERASAITEITDYIQKNSSPSDGLFVIPYEVMWYFLCDKKNPTKFDYLMPGQIDKDIESDIIHDLENNPPKFVIYQDTSLNGKEETKLKNFANTLHNFILANFMPVFSKGEYTIMQAK